MGNERTTTLNLKVVKIDKDQNLLFVKGAVPGPNGGVIIVRSAKKKQLAKQGK
jgi:large subunit ribosomal protein L3